jgi:hypothetical protein
MLPKCWKAQQKYIKDLKYINIIERLKYLKIERFTSAAQLLVLGVIPKFSLIIKNKGQFHSIETALLLEKIESIKIKISYFTISFFVSDWPP